MNAPMDTLTGTAEAYPETMRSGSRHELQRLRSSWLWFMLLGALLVFGGFVAIMFPVISSVAAVSVLGLVLIIGGVATVIGSFWAGRWSGFLVQLLVGILYVAAGMAVTEQPLISTLMIAYLLAVSFMALGVFRVISALIIRYPQWGWALLNGVVTFLCGEVIYRNLEVNALWVIGLLVGLEMLFNGWTWIMLATELRRLPPDASA